MGAFHEGHLALMRKARQLGDIVVVSLFVNPTQFGPNEDFERYPRDEARDFDLAESAGVDVMFCPTVDEMYPSKATAIHVEGVSRLWEGEARPGHFDGVATVVAKLFNIVRPDIAIFGLKDFQQCAVVAELVKDLKYPIAIVLVDTVREADGLARSSRNTYLTQEQRTVAPLLYNTLKELSASLSTAEGASSQEDSLERAKRNLDSAGFVVEYLAVVDAISLEPVLSAKTGDRIIVAARLGATRLIDNLAV